jgi:hypothetical protein
MGHLEFTVKESKTSKRRTEMGQTFTSNDTTAGVTGINDNTTQQAGPGVHGKSAAAGVWGESTTWHGVVGQSTSPTGGAGVMGEGVGPGVIGTGQTWHGIYGASSSTTGGAGVWGEHKAGGIGVQGVSPTAVGVQGNSTSGRGIAGFSDSGQGVYGFSNTQAGVVGESNSFDGVFGISHNLNAAGVSGHNPGGLAGYFDGYIKAHNPGNMAGYFDGNVTVMGDIFLPGADCAEQFDVAGAQACEPGTVMVIDEGGTLKPSESAYDRRVAGVVSGAGSFRPAVVLDRQAEQANRATIALVGKVYCKADADLEPISVGDMLTTSPRAGHAMKADDAAKAFGSIIGKALRPLAAGQGLVPILIALQ